MPNPLSGVLKRAFPMLYGTKPPTGYGLVRFGQPGSLYDYQTKAGNLWLNGVVASGLNWASRAASEAIWQVQERKGDGWEPTEKGAALDVLSMLDEPNPWYDGHTLVKALMTSDWCAGDGYLLKARNNRNEVVGLVWVAHWRVHPVTISGTSLIDGYEYIPENSGESIPLRREDVVHVRDGANPVDPRHGISRLAGEIRRIVSDNEWSGWQASLALNSASPGSIISPRASDPNPPTPAQLKEARRLLSEFKQDRRGDSFALPVAVEFFRDAWSPADLRLNELQRSDVTRICAAMGFDPMVLGHESSSKTYANLEEAMDGAGNGTLIPDLNRYGRQIGRQVLADFGLDPKRYRLGFDYSKVSWLSDETDKMHDRVRKDFVANIISQQRAQELIGEKSDPSGVFYWQLKPAPVVAAPGDNAGAARTHADRVRRSGEALREHGL